MRIKIFVFLTSIRENLFIKVLDIQIQLQVFRFTQIESNLPQLAMMVPSECGIFENTIVFIMLW